jgi:transcriptional regulator with XRE-family HTH domain
MNEPLVAPPEGTLIKQAQRSMRISQREAARRADLSEARWRQLVSGYMLVQRTYVPVRSPDKTLARMARAVGVTADELASAGREGAAEALRDVEAEAERVARVAAEQAAIAAMGEGPNRVDERWPLVEAVLRQAASGLSVTESAILTERVSALLTPRRGQ